MALLSISNVLKELPRLTTDDIKEADESIAKTLDAKAENLQGKYIYTPGCSYISHSTVLLQLESKCLGTCGSFERSCQFYTPPLQLVQK